MATRNPSGAWQGYLPRAFTLIELLVVITILAILVSILLPAISQARNTGYMIRESAAAKQQITAWTNYTSDYKGGVIIPYVHWSWAHPQNPPGVINMLPRDPADPLRVLEGDVVKVWTWRFITYSELPTTAMQIDRATHQILDRRHRNRTGGSGTFSNIYDDVTSYQYGMAWHPTFGLNSVYVGGHYRRGAFPNGSANSVGHPRRNQGGQFYVTKIESIRNPSMLMVMSSARSVDVATSSRFTIDYGGNPVPFTPSSQILPGYYEVLPPRTGFPLTGGSAQPWSASNNFDKTKAPQTWGCVDFRYGNRAVSAMADGHVELLSIEKLRDMRRWANHAGRADWNFTPGN